MARSGLTKSQVRAVRDRLLADGRYPSVDAVRHALGDCGSKSTIHKHLKDLRDEDPDGGIKRADTEDALRGFVEGLADRLHAQAEERIRALQAAHAQALQQKDSELAALRATLASLGARVQTLETQALATVPHEVAHDPAPDWRMQKPGQGAQALGFGRFDSALLMSRSSQQDVSAFDMIRRAARS